MEERVYRDRDTGKYWTMAEIQSWIRTQNMFLQLRQKNVESDAELERWDYFKFL